MYRGLVALVFGSFLFSSINCLLPLLHKSSRLSQFFSISVFGLSLRVGSFRHVHAGLRVRTGRGRMVGSNGRGQHRRWMGLGRRTLCGSQTPFLFEIPGRAATSPAAAATATTKSATATTTTKGTIAGKRQRIERRCRLRRRRIRRKQHRRQRRRRWWRR